MWKFQDFYVIQILREIIFEESRSCKSANFDILGALKFVKLLKIHFQKMQEFLKKSKFRASKCVKMADFALPESSKLISRKMCEIEKT